MDAPLLDDAGIAAEAARLTPGLVDDVVRLSRIPSVATDGFPVGPLHEAHDVAVDMLRAAGVQEISQIMLDGMTTPTIVADVAGPPGAPTVLVYTHYDVVPAGDDALWSSPPFEPVVVDGTVVGRGTADSKANIAAIAGAIRVWGARRP